MTQVADDWRRAAENADLPGAMDQPRVHYAVARDGGVPHVYLGDLPPGIWIGRPALCGLVVVRLAHPSETGLGRICRRCERRGASR